MFIALGDMKQQGNQDGRVLDRPEGMRNTARQALEVACPHHIAGRADGELDASFQAVHRQFADDLVLGYLLAGEQHRAKHLEALRLVQRGSTGVRDGAGKWANADQFAQNAW